MLQLRIKGLEGEHEAPVLVLSDPDGGEYRVPVDAALRDAVNQASTAAKGASPKVSPLSPRQIQAKLRAGATVDDVVATSGQSREYVVRFAGPVADERAFHAERARSTQIARASTAENHRLAFGDGPATLEAMVAVRLRSLGVDAQAAVWDAYRRTDGRWAVTCDFEVESKQEDAAIGGPPPARWIYNPVARVVHPDNHWAQTLSVLPAAASGQKSRRLRAVEEPFDVDSGQDGGSEGAGGRGRPGAGSPGGTGEGPAGGGAGHDAEDLLDILRARRGQRLGSDEQGDDKLATLLTRDEQVGSPSLKAVEDSGAESESRSADEQTTDPLPGVEEISEGTADDDTDAWGFRYDAEAEDGPQPQDSPPQEASDTEPAESEPQGSARERSQPQRSTKKSRRPSMPRWDDILFGSKDD